MKKVNFQKTKACDVYTWPDKELSRVLLFIRHANLSMEEHVKKLKLGTEIPTKDETPKTTVQNLLSYFSYTHAFLHLKTRFLNYEIIIMQAEVQI